ncbi:tetratricopeptide repeat protein [Clostridium sp.]|uniref:tetratricopeptide repeat protein n=1 Tax=Clostridium sp. TaxID=1506 RepID=UPI003D6C924B
MDKSGKTYVKAMNKYNDGYIDKSLALCEKSISLNVTNAAALNLKGILYYLKGDLENAKRTWNINYKRNNDKISKKYMKDSLHDVEKLKLYASSLELVKAFNISAALEILNQCKNSDFNFINVNNLISLCYIKQGEYDKALSHIEKVLKTDKKNTEAIMNKKTLINYGNLKREINYKKIFIGCAGVLVIISLILLSKGYIYKLKNISTMGTNKIEKSTELVRRGSSVSIEKSTEKKPIENKTIDIPKFPKELLAESIKNNNMEQIVGYLNEWSKVDLDMNDKLLMVKGEELIKSNGIVYFYEKGIENMEDKKYTEAEKYFLYGLPYSKDNYLNEHIIYMLAVSYKSSSDFEKASKYYKDYLKQFSKGSYTEEVLYNLILINKDLDKNKAVGYAERLVERFPNSQYYNTIVKNILK